MTSVPEQRKDHSPAVRLGHDAVSAVKLSQQLTAEIDAWAEAHRITRADAISCLVQRGLTASLPDAPHPPLRDPLEIERHALKLIERMLDPSLPADERERRIRQLIEGPPEFWDARIDLPRHPK